MSITRSCQKQKLNKRIIKSKPKCFDDNRVYCKRNSTGSNLVLKKSKTTKNKGINDNYKNEKGLFIMVFSLCYHQEHP